MNTDQIIKLARMHYEQNLSQEDIAQRENISRATVSRALKESRERGYIRMLVIPPSEMGPILEEWLQSRFNLKYVAVTPTREDDDESIRLVGQVAAVYLDNTVASNHVLGLAGGRTLLSTAKQVKLAQRPNVTVLPIMGGWIGHTSISASEVAREISLRWNSRARVLFAPAFVVDEIARDALLREETIFSTLEMARKADIAVIGIASVSLEETSREYVSGTGRISGSDVSQIIKKGVVGETCAQFFDIKGNPVDVWNRTRTIAVPLDDLAKMANVVAVGAGVSKGRPFLGACRMGIVKSLIVSEDLAMEMKRLDSTE